MANTKNFFSVHIISNDLILKPGTMTLYEVKKKYFH